MEKKGFKDILKKILYAKLGITTCIFAFYLGAKSHTVVRRIEDSILYRNVPVSANSFQDPAGLDTIIEINESGEKEVYLMHSESGKKVSIGYDLLPKNPEDLQKGLENRMYNTKYRISLPFSAQETAQQSSR
ncbi:hypothetical protein JW707_00940 [Candidatus Woesearchaeota archaeon]|nr:hypothetical protein [Candidatus Woesearchaeota archaeon]